MTSPRQSIILALLATSVIALAEEKAAKVTKEDVDRLYQIAWATLRLDPPKLEPIDSDALPKLLDGKYDYQYRDELEEGVVKGRIRFQYPNYNWRTQQTRGVAKLYGDKIALYGENGENDLRALLGRVGGEWHLMQLDFPGGKVILKPTRPNKAQK